MRKYGRRNRVYVGFVDFKKVYDREALWQVPRMYDVGAKIFSSIKSIYIIGLACVRIKG